MKNSLSISLLAVFIFALSVAGIILALREKAPSGNVADSNASNVVVVDGRQIIEINAKGGYFPAVSYAKADLPTVIKVKTKGTFDCSASLAIPTIDFRQNLPSSGETLIDIGPQKAGSVFRGMCSMGMYGFEVRFE